jgi:hypothetical protein
MDKSKKSLWGKTTKRIDFKAVSPLTLHLSPLCKLTLESAIFHSKLMALNYVSF